MAGVQLLLPTIPSHDLANHDEKDSCYVTIGANVYDVTFFLSGHPGGGDLILEYGGRDVSQIMGDEWSHVHFKAAYQILNDHLIGSISNEVTVKPVIDHLSPNDSVPMSSSAKEVAAAEASNTAAPDQRKTVSNNPRGVTDMTKETDSAVDFATLKFLDLNKPLLPQLWNGGFSKEFYLSQVHRPRYHPKGASAPLSGNFLEPLSLTPWYIVPLIWLPPAIYGTIVANQRMPSAMTTAWYLIIGFLLFPLLVEYWVHRAAHHMDRFVRPRSLQNGKSIRVPMCSCWLTPKKKRQLPSRQSYRYHDAFSPPWHPPLPPHGQTSASDAAISIRLSRNRILLSRTSDNLLGLARSDRRLLRWIDRIRQL